MIKDNIDKIIEKVIEMTASGGVSATYDNKAISLNFKLDEKFDLKVDDDLVMLWYTTENNCSPVEVKFKKSDVAKTIYYAKGEFPDCTCIAVIQIYLTDGSELDIFEDYR